MSFQELFQALVKHNPGVKVELKCLPRSIWSEFCSSRNFMQIIHTDICLPLNNVKCYFELHKLLFILRVKHMDLVIFACDLCIALKFTDNVLLIRRVYQKLLWKKQKIIQSSKIIMYLNVTSSLCCITIFNECTHICVSIISFKEITSLLTLYMKYC